MDYITTKKATKNCGITDRMAVYYCSNGQIKKAEKMGNSWLIPINAEKPTDRQYRHNKVDSGENK